MSYTRRYDWEEDDRDATVYLSRYLRVRLTGSDKNPLPRGKCRIAGDEGTIFQCDNKGVVKIPLTNWNQTSIDLQWEPEDAENKDPADRFFFQNTFKIAITSIDDDVCRDRLTNLGFFGNSLKEQVNAYQHYFGRTQTGNLNDIRDEMVRWHDGGEIPGQI